MNEDVREGCNGPVGARWQQQSRVMDRVILNGGFPPVVHVTQARRRQAPEIVVSRGAGTSQQFPVPQQGNEPGRRRRKRIQSTAGLQNPATDSAAKGRIIHPEPGKRWPPGSPAATFQGF